MNLEGAKLVVSAQQNFITGTGRCGSTILSRMLMRHPDALVLREFFSTLDARRFAPGRLSGDELADVLSFDRHPVIPFLQRGGTMPEILYRLDDEQRRQPDLKIPGLLLVAFAYISEQPESLLERLLAWARAQPARTMRGHYPELFAFLCEQTARRTCIEASATNNLDLGVFPNPRVLHVHRSGPEVVLSMGAHPFFRLMASLALEPLSADEWSTIRARAARDADDPLCARMAATPSSAFDPFFAHMWTSSVARNVRVFTQLPRAQVLELPFEQLLAAPVPSLLRVAEFFGLSPLPAWAQDAATMLSPVPLRLPAQEPKRQRELARLCAVGQILTGREQRARFDLPAETTEDERDAG